MAKEMMIVFIYDTLKTDEYHDPVKSVVYFHPSWVSESQKLLLCGQLMGTAHFLSEVLSKPKLISLQSGKFAIKTFGRFLLAVGSDRNMSETILEHRANFLYILIQMYHCDINSIYEQFNSTYDEKKFVDKMYSIMEGFLPLLQFNGNIFQNVSSLKIPKSASNLYLETNQILQSFQQTEGVLGGTILYHNKVVASQISDNLTKIFTLSDLYRLKSSEYIEANYHIPIGVTLINAYIPVTEYTELIRSSSQSHNLFINSTSKDIVPFQLRKKSFCKDTHSITKRDKSLIFTHIPEEEQEDGFETIKLSHKRKPIFIRPTHLPLFKNPTSLGITESGFNSINFDETDSFPSFIGKTSVCSTPMAENIVLSHSNVLSICAASEGINQERQSHKKNGCEKFHLACENKSTQKLLSGKQKQVDNNCFTNFIPTLIKTSHIRSSMPNINKFDSSTENDDDYNAYDVNSDEYSLFNIKKIRSSGFCRTIADPVYPIFGSDGSAISYSLFKKNLDQDYDYMKNISILRSDLQPTETYIVSETNHKKPEALDQLFRTNSKKNRHGLSLPLEALDLQRTELNQTSKILESPTRRKKLPGIQLTPLMSKLTLLAMSDQQSSGLSGLESTPGCNFNNPLEYQPKRNKSKNNASCGSVNDEECLLDSETNKFVKVELFICVQQNMTLLLILKEKSSEKEDIIHSLFETCVSKLIKIENSLHQVMSISVEGFDKGDGGYSFISLDSKWDVNSRCGSWNSRDLLTLNLIHNHFYKSRRLTELLLRSQDAVIYSYRCGKSEIYYQQPTLVQPGLPPPQDVMGTVSLCAKRRLERDYRILLL